MDRDPTRTQRRRFAADPFILGEEGSRVDGLDDEGRRRVIERLDRTVADPDEGEHRARFYDLSGIASGRRVVDVGCGTGLDSRAMAIRVAPQGSVLGLDPSRTLLQEARRRTHPEVPARYQAASGDRLPLTSESVDRAVAIDVLGHIPDPAPVVAELARVVRPGGRVGLFEADLGTLVIDGADRDMTERIIGAWTREIPSADAGRRLQGLLRGAGLRGIQVIPLPLVDGRFSPLFRLLVEDLVRVAAEDGGIPADAVEGWRLELSERAAEGRFFACLMRFAAVGLK